MWNLLCEIEDLPQSGCHTAECHCVTHAQALQFYRKAYKVRGHQGKRTHERLLLLLPGNTSLGYTTHAHFIACRFRRVLSTAATATKQMLSINSEVKTERLLFHEQTQQLAASVMQVKVTPSHTPLLNLVGNGMSVRTLLDLIRGSDAGHHYSSVRKVCMNEN